MTEAYIPTLRTGEPLAETQRKCAGIGTSLETVRAALTTAEGSLVSLDARLDELDWHRSTGRALRFDGTNDDATGDAGDGDPGAGPFKITIAMRFRGEGASASQCYVGKRSALSSGSGFAFRHSETGGNLVFEIEDGSGNEAQIQYSATSAELDDDKVHLVVLARSLDEDEIWMYLDGTLVGSADASSVGVVSSTSALTFGSIAGTNYAAMDLLWYSMEPGEFTQAQIAALGVSLPVVSSVNGLRYEVEEGSGNPQAWPPWRTAFVTGPKSSGHTISIADSAALSPSSLTVQVKLHMTDMSANINVFQKNLSFILRVSSGQRLQGFIHDGTAFRGSFTSTRDLYEYEVLDLVMTYDESDKSFAGYINGEVFGNSPITLSSMLTGAMNDSSKNTEVRFEQFGGTVFLARMYSEALGASAVAEIASSSDDSARSSCIFEWLLNDGSGTAATDNANSNDGTLNGASIGWGASELAVSGATWVDDGENWYLKMREGYPAT